jgi:hypothetical protein
MSVTLKLFIYKLREPRGSHSFYHKLSLGRMTDVRRDVFAMPSLVHNIRLTRPRDGHQPWSDGTYQKHVNPSHSELRQNGPWQVGSELGPGL